jgi:hypothetical protein
MKSIILTIGFVLTSMVAMSQYVETVREWDFPLQEWYEIPGEQFEGVKYITSDDKWIKNYLKEMLAEDSVSISKPDTIQREHGVIIYMEWNYKTLDGHEVNVSYINNGFISDISFYYFD